MSLEHHLHSLASANYFFVGYCGFDIQAKKKEIEEEKFPVRNSMSIENPHQPEKKKKNGNE